MMNAFGDFLRNKRLSLYKGLRAFCLENGLDASNYSKIERGVSPPPSNEKIKQYAKFLKIEEDSEEWIELFDLAAVAKRTIPDYVYNNEKFVASLPLLFRKSESGCLYSEKELQQLFEDFKASK